MIDKISNLSLSNRQSKLKSKKATSKVNQSTRILEDQRKAICLGMGVSGIGVCGSLNYIQIHNHTKLTTLILENISKSKSRFIHRDPEAQGHNLGNWLEVSSMEQNLRGVMWSVENKSDFKLDFPIIQKFMKYSEENKTFAKLLCQN